MSPFAWNIMLALIWISVSGDLSGSNLLTGFLFGYLILGLSLRRIPEVAAYLRRIPNLAAFSLYFLKELCRANLKVAWDVVTPTDYMRPAVIAFPLEARTDIEVVILANLISLTPGSLTLDISSDRKVIYIHVMYFSDSDAELKQFKAFEKRLLTMLGGRMPEFATQLAFFLLGASLVLTFVRLIKGPTLPDRVVALELMASLTVAFIGVHAVASDRGEFLDVAMVLALTAFLAAVGFSRYLEKRGYRDD